MSKEIIFDKKINKKLSKPQWTSYQIDFSNQLNQLLCIDECRELQSHIKEKIRNYKNQDIRKNKFCSEKFIHFEYIKSLLLFYQLRCYYCQTELRLCYNDCRDMSQWSIERIDNLYGHNMDNVVVSCLQCNLNRNSSSSINHLKTKRLLHIVKL
jgi:hypothetical protein